MMTTTARVRTRPAAPVQVVPPPSNVVELRPGFTLPEAPKPITKARKRTRSGVTTRANLLTEVTTETGKKTTENNDLLRVPGLVQLPVEVTLSPPRVNPSAKDPTFQRLIARLSATKLREAFPSEASSYNNMMGRQRQGNYTVAPAFGKFRDFLADVGPKPHEDWSIDRKDPRNPVYGPGLVRWADKRSQSNNRAITVHLTNHDGVTRPLADWARLTGQERRTLAKRLERGWTHAEIIRGSRVEDEPIQAAPVVLPVAAPIAAPDGAWPINVLHENWEPHWRAFSTRYRQRFGVRISRPVLYLWLTSNYVAAAITRLQNRYPGYLDPETHPDDQPDVSHDPDYRILHLFTEPQAEALCSMEPEGRELALALRNRWRKISSPAQLSTIVFDPPDW